MTDLRLERPCTQLADIDDLAEPPDIALAELLPPESTFRRRRRKWWEMVFLAQSAQACGCLDGQAKAIGLGVGREPLIFYFARHCAEVLATDIYSAEATWQEAKETDLSGLHEHASFDYPRDHVSFRHADMRDLGVPDASYDFAWSCSSIEHIPTLKDLLRVFEELYRVLKPGGYAFLTTEFCLTPGPYLLPGLNCLDASLFDDLVRPLKGLEVVGDVDLSYNWQAVGNAPEARRYLPLSMRTNAARDCLLPHVGGHIGRYVGISVIAPIGFVLRKTDYPCDLPTWDQLPLTDSVRAYTNCIEAVRAERFADAATIAERHLADPSDKWPLQFRLHWMRYYIESLARTLPQDDPLVRQQLDTFTDALPPGALQDADCIDLVAYLFGELGDVDRSCRLLEQAIWSPSTTAEHVMQLACRHLSLMRARDRWEAGADLICELWTDFARQGSITGTSVRRFIESLAELALPPKEISALCRRLKNALADTSSSASNLNEKFLTTLAKQTYDAAFDWPDIYP